MKKSHEVEAQKAAFLRKVIASIKQSPQGKEWRGSLTMWIKC